MFQMLIQKVRRTFRGALANIDARRPKSQPEPPAPTIPTDAQLKRDREELSRLAREGQREGRRSHRMRQQGQANPQLAQQIDYLVAKHGPEHALKELMAIGQGKKRRQP